MLLEALQIGTRRVYTQEPFVQERLHIQSDRTHIAHDLRWRLLIDEHQRLLAPLARGGGEICRQTAFTGPRSARYQDTAPAINALAGGQHAVEFFHARRDE